MSNLINSIDNYLINNNFKKVKSNQSIQNYKLTLEKNHSFFVSIFIDDFLSIDLYSIFELGKDTYAKRYQIKNFKEFIFLITKTSRSPLFQITNH